MDFSDVFRIVNFGAGGLMIAGSIVHFFHRIAFDTVILSVYIAIFGLAVILLEFQIPPQIARYASFLFSFLGRGIFYIFIGSIMLADNTFNVVLGSAVGIIGLVYAALEFVPSIEPPSNMREADGGWGAEQV